MYRFIWTAVDVHMHSECWMAWSYYTSKKPFDGGCLFLLLSSNLLCFPIWFGIKV